MIPRDPSGMMSTPESARFLGVSPSTIRSWRERGWLAKQGLDERGFPLHTAAALRAAERLVVQHGIDTSGVNPRLLRGRSREPQATQAGEAQAA